MKVLLDEHISPAVARALRERGYDAESVAEREDLRGSEDVDVLVAAAAEGRATVTADVDDFSRLGLGRLPTHRWHAGIILVSPSKFSLSGAGIGSLIRALEHAMTSGIIVDDLAGEVIWLRPAPEDPTRS